MLDEAYLAEEFLALSASYLLEDRYDITACDEEGHCGLLCREIGCMKFKIDAANRLLAAAKSPA